MQGGRGVGDLRVQLGGRARSGSRASRARRGSRSARAARWGRPRGRPRAARPCAGTRRRARRPRAARVQWARRPSTLCLWSSAAATSDGSTSMPRLRAHATMCRRRRSRTAEYSSRSSGPNTSRTGRPSQPRPSSAAAGGDDHRIGLVKGCDATRACSLPLGGGPAYPLESAYSADDHRGAPAPPQPQEAGTADARRHRPHRHERRHRPDGIPPAPRPVRARHPRRRRRAASGRLAPAGRAGAGGAQPREAHRHRPPPRHRRGPHRPRRRARRGRGVDLLRLPGHERAQEGDPARDRRRQARLHGEAARRVGGRGPRSWSTPPARRDRRRRGARQDLPARPDQAEAADRLRVLRPRSCRCAASSATGCSRAT